MAAFCCRVVLIVLIVLLICSGSGSSAESKCYSQGNPSSLNPAYTYEIAVSSKPHAAVHWKADFESGILALKFCVDRRTWISVGISSTGVSAPPVVLTITCLMLVHHCSHPPLLFVAPPGYAEQRRSGWPIKQSSPSRKVPDRKWLQALRRYFAA